MPLYFLADFLYGNNHLRINCINGYIENISYLFVFQSIFPYQFKNHFATGW